MARLYKTSTMKILFATNNTHKVNELRQILPSRFELVTPADFNCYDDVEETGSTLEENALIKARYLYSRFGISCFADDTGLEIDALNGAPGVYSARYAGENKDSRENVARVLCELNGENNRKARFRTVIALILDGKEYLFEGTVNGTISVEAKGNSGFGYDPIFVPEGYQLNFAEMDAEMKNSISHRKRATDELVRFLDKV